MREGRRGTRPRRAAVAGGAAGRDLSPRNQRRRSARGSVRRRTSPGRPPRPPSWAALGAGDLLTRWSRPGLRVLVLCAMLSVGVLLLTSPAFAARHVDISGAHHLSTAEVLRRSGLGDQQNVFLVTPESAEAALRSDPYVRSVSVRTLLPDRVDVSISEWEPLALLHRAGRDLLLNAEGTVLGPGTAMIVGPAAGQPHVEVTWAAPAPLRTGERALPGLLVQDLDRIQRAFPAAYHLTVKAITLSVDQQLVLETAEGPRILFGQMVTDEQVASLDAKLASLKDLSNHVDIGHSKLEYVNLMNPAQPVTHAVPSPSPSVKPSPSPSRR